MPPIESHPDALLHLVIYIVLFGMILRIAVDVVGLLRGGKKKDYIDKEHLETFARETGKQIRMAILEHKADEKAHAYATKDDIHDAINECRTDERQRVEVALRARMTPPTPSKL